MHQDELLQEYKVPPMPENFEYVSGVNDKFIIRNKIDKSEFVWIPTLNLQRINFQNDVFSDECFHEEITEELSKQLESVKKYGGFYISRFNISQSIEGKPVSVENAVPWTQVSWYEAKSIAESYGDGKNFKSHLPYASEIDPMLAWLKSLNLNYEHKLVGNSTDWKQDVMSGAISINMLNDDENQLLKVSDIFSMDGNIDSWTQEQCGSNYKTVRGTGFINLGENFSAAFRQYEDPNSRFFDTGFRITLCIQ